jgi:hypothetical protein
MLSHRSGSAVSRSPRARVLLLATIAALVVTTFEAHAAPVVLSSSASGQDLAAANGTEVGARKRYRSRRGNAAGLAMMGMVAGTIGAVIASEQRRDAYRRAQYYDPYGYDPYAYRQPYAYQQHPRVYQQPRVYHQQRPYVGGPSPGAAAIHERRQYIDPQNPNSAVPTGVPRIGF